ncbi:hypothetical protein [Embleya sp. NPDC001921]
METHRDLVAARWAGLLTADEILAEVRPAAVAVAAENEAGRLARERLPLDAEIWTVALRLVPEFAGTLPQLFATAAAMAERRTSWADPGVTRAPTPPKETHGIPDQPIGHQCDQAAEEALGAP